MLSKTLRLNFSCLKIFDLFHLCHHPKIIGHIIKNNQKCKSVFIYKTARLIIKKIKMKMKNRSHRYEINRPRSRHEHKYSKYKK